MADMRGSELAQRGAAIIGATLGPDPAGDVRVLLEDLSVPDLHVLVTVLANTYTLTTHALSSGVA